MRRGNRKLVLASILKSDVGFGGNAAEDQPEGEARHEPQAKHASTTLSALLGQLADGVSCKQQRCQKACACMHRNSFHSHLHYRENNQNHRRCSTICVLIVLRNNKLVQDATCICSTLQGTIACPVRHNPPVRQLSLPLVLRAIEFPCAWFHYARWAGLWGSHSHDCRGPRLFMAGADTNTY
jgi:hypothetical protein